MLLLIQKILFEILTLVTRTLPKLHHKVFVTIDKTNIITQMISYNGKKKLVFKSIPYHVKNTLEKLTYATTKL